MAASVAAGPDHEYQRHGTLSLLAGIGLRTGKVHACRDDLNCEPIIHTWTYKIGEAA